MKPHPPRTHPAASDTRRGTPPRGRWRGHPAPTDRFDSVTSGWGSIWLSLLAVQLVLYARSGASLRDCLVATVAVVVFSACYSYGLGAVRYFPRLLPAQYRAPAFVGVLLLITVLTALVTGSFALIFVPFLVAFVLFGFPTTQRSLARVLVAGTVVILLGAFLVQVNTLPIIISILFIIIFGIMTSYEQRRKSLETELVLSQDRELIAADIHDLLGHTLTVINLKAEVARRAMSINPEAAAEELASIAELSRQALNEVRSTVTRIAAPSFADTLTQCRAACVAAGVAVTFPTPGAVAQPTGETATLFAWGLKELTTNALRHARATQITVTYDDSTLTVADNGCGVPEGAACGGLRGLRRRAEALGGSLTIMSRDQQGTTVTLQRPRARGDA
ncbi:two-component sensor histidine kinase [Corynebacterium sp. 13CS0277]|uniref:sensor histidine kinase n=1 Tax=Corynebacterium sp. 13CS0277 TaxID=2071994 RepID=UPI000D048279|nr:histidine kinase [Corynebacterium sp. 13CS0277]PRQ12135.1 two-component sensor histidine kinase [Corynebacterium sp. 13CS0277]